MIRVTKPGARFVIADQVSAEDPDKAALHNDIERLCDPTHVRALSESEFERLFATIGLIVAFKAHATIDYSVREWMSHVEQQAPADSEDDVLSAPVQKIGLELLELLGSPDVASRSLSCNA